MSVDNPWRQEEIDVLIAKYKAGAFASAIGKELGRSRNSILGKADRMGLKRPGVVERLPRARYESKPKKRSFSTRPLTGMYRGMEWKPPVHHDTGSVPLHSVKPGQCRYIALGAAGLETLMCGEPIFKPPYCGYHDQLCHLKRKSAPALTRAVASEAVPPAPSPVAEWTASLSPAVGNDGSVGESRGPETG